MTNDKNAEDKKKEHKESEAHKLAISREKSRKDMIGHLEAAQKAQRAAELTAAKIEEEKDEIIKELRAELKAAKAKITTLQKAAPKPKKQESKWKPITAPKFELKGNDVQILQKKGTKEYPDSIFPVARLLADDMEKGITLDDLKGFISDEYGTGKYILKAFEPDENGIVKPRGSVEISV